MAFSGPGLVISIGKEAMLVWGARDSGPQNCL